jgi:hypothetical protein
VRPSLDVQPFFVGGEGQAVGLFHVIDHGADLPVLRINAVDLRGAHLAGRRIALVVRINAVGGVGEPDAVVGLDHHIVG